VGTFLELRIGKPSLILDLSPAEFIPLDVPHGLSNMPVLLLWQVTLLDVPGRDRFSVVFGLVRTTKLTNSFILNIRWPVCVTTPSAEHLPGVSVFAS
jgi:hypothetical protein